MPSASPRSRRLSPSPSPTPSETPTPSPSPTETPGPTPTPDTTSPDVSVGIVPTVPYTTSVVTFTATASDASGIAKIQIWVQFVPVPSDNHPHFWGREQECLGTTTCSVAKGPYGQTGVLSYYAVAWDGAGNRAFTATYSVNVVVEIK